MHEAPALVLFELSGAEGLRFSPYCWRSRYALAHKGLAATLLPVRFTDKAQLAPSGHERVPVLRDGDTWVGDSWHIALYLEERNPQPPLFPAGRALARLVNEEVDGELHPLILRAIVPEILERVDPADRSYFRASRERRLGDTIESFAARRGEFTRALAPKLARFEAALAEAPYLAGDAPAYVDYVLAGTLEWIARASTLPIPAAGSRLAAWFGNVRARYRTAR